MDCSIVLTCEYIFNNKECISYLTHTYIDPGLYNYVYNIFAFEHVKHKKRTRKLRYVNTTHLVEYSNVMMIIFDDAYDENVYKMPNTITHLQFGESFNSQIHTLPNSLRDLVFGDYYNREIPPLPNNLIRLVLGDGFNHTILKLPYKLRYLVLGDAFNHEIDFPITLEYLHVGRSYNKLIRQSSNLKIIRVHMNYIYLNYCATIYKNTKIIPYAVNRQFNITNGSFIINF
jgi:hypothetical protein